MASFELPLWAGLSLVGGPVLFAQGFRAMRKRQLIQNTPTARIRSMSIGRVEINGVVVARSAVAAPFSGRPCVHWQVDISTQSLRKRNWSVVHRNASGHPFFLRDDTGLALVYPEGAECDVRFGVEEECIGVMLPELYSRYMDEQDLPLRHLWRLGAMRFRERILEEGQQVYVLGHAAPRPQVVDLSGEQALAATGTDGYRAGRIRGLDDQVCAIVRRGEHERTFLISQESERMLTFGLGLSAMAQIVAGPALTLFGLGYWLHVLAIGQNLFR